MSQCWIYIFLLTILAFAVNGQDAAIFREYSTFFTRPDIILPKIDITKHNSSRITPGYWFLTAIIGVPKALSKAPDRPAYSLGPLIIDNQGDLIWSGTNLFAASNLMNVRTWDFRPTMQTTPGLSFLGAYPSEAEMSGIIMDDSYRVRQTVQVKRGKTNLHEFNLVDNCTSALVISHEQFDYNSSEYGNVWLHEQGFQEINLRTNEVLFDWMALDHLNTSESVFPTEKRRGWDYIHINSLDKDANGDYLVSARHTSTIYKISGSNGSILWRLGGKYSSFVAEGFDMSGQHNARFRGGNESTTIISFFNNANIYDKQVTAAKSSALLVALDHSSQPLRATILKEWSPPDGTLAEAMGGIDFLPNSNAVVSWGSSGLISEFTYDGDCVFEARFVPAFHGSYRAYKFNFTGHPAEPPIIKAFASDVGTSNPTTQCWVSWNGATEVSSWAFYSSGKNLSSFTYIGSVTKSGFETAVHIKGLPEDLFVRAIASDGRVLGESDTTAVSLTQGAHLTTENFETLDWDSCKNYSESTALSLRGRIAIIGFFISTIVNGALIACWVQSYKLRKPSIAYATIGKDSMDDIREH